MTPQAPSPLSPPNPSDYLWLESLPFGAACFQRSQLRLLQANTLFKNWFCPSAGPGESIPDILVEQIGESRLRSALNEVIESQRTLTFPIEFKVGLGSKKIACLVRISSSAQFNADTVLFLIEDISAQRKSQILGESVARLQDENLKRLAESRANMRRVLDQLPQAFLLFNRHLEVTHTYSSLAEQLFPAGATQRNIRELTGLKGSYFDPFFHVLFEDIDQDLIDDMSPKETQLGERLISLRFVRLAQDGLENQALCVLEDITQVRLLQNKVREKELLHYQILHAVMYREPFICMLERSRGLGAMVDTELTFRQMVHGLKSNLDFFGFHELARACNDWESQNADLNEMNEETALQLSQTIEETLSTFITEQSDILRMDPSSAGLQFPISIHRIEHLKQAIDEGQSKDQLAQHLRNWIELPIHQALGWLNGVWITSLESLGKRGAPIQFETTSARISPHCNRELFSLLPLAIRNAADHGIETMGLRQDAGKPIEGQLRVRLDEIQNDQGGHYLLQITDDGAGVAWEKIRGKALTSGEKQAKNWSAQKLLGYLLSGGVSTKEKPTELSGRGIGLSALAAAIEKQGGTLAIQSTPGEGTRLELRFPKFSCLDSPRVLSKNHRIKGAA